MGILSEHGAALIQIQTSSRLWWCWLHGTILEGGLSDLLEKKYRLGVLPWMGKPMGLAVGMASVVILILQHGIIQLFDMTFLWSVYE